MQRRIMFPRRAKRSGVSVQPVRSCTYRSHARPAELSHSRRDSLLNHLFVTPRDIIDPGFSAARTHRRTSCHRRVSTSGAAFTASIQSTSSLGDATSVGSVNACKLRMKSALYLNMNRNCNNARSRHEGPLVAQNRTRSEVACRPSDSLVTSRSTLREVTVLILNRAWFISALKTYALYNRNFFVFFSSFSIIFYKVTIINIVNIFKGKSRI